MNEFRNRTHYPGTHGGPFEVIVRGGMLIERIPNLLFALVVIGWAYIVTGGEWSTFVLFVIVLISDWLLLALLPHAGMSYGPAKPIVLLLALLRTPFLFLPSPWIWAVQSVGTILVGYGFWIEPQRVTVTREKLTTSKLPPGVNLRILHFGDLHIERITPRDRRLVDKIDELKPDLILFSGDLLSYSNVNDRQSWEETTWVFNQLDAPMGIFAVQGSPAVDEKHIMEAIYSHTNVQLLDDEKITINGDYKVELIGISCSHKPFIDAPKIHALVSEDDTPFKILLYHTPDLAPFAGRESIDLQLSGHTHGGQVRLPLFGALFTASLYGKRFEAGRYQLDGMTLYVTRGLGMEGMAAPRVRFLCPPEIVVWELEGSDGVESQGDSV